MCGIAGLATGGHEPARDLLTRMCDVIEHRGPDGAGFYVAPGVGLGMRRLAIIDLTTGDQPVSDSTGNLQAVFNGEIYNYRELRAELLAEGHMFRSQGDSEVIPHLYQRHGLDALRRLNGMFAIALWDAPRRTLLLARDRAGIKPLYYSVRNSTLYFGSEVKSILAAGGSTREIDAVGVDQLLTFEYTAGPTTLFRDVHKLPAGGWLTWTNGEIRTGRFWAPEAMQPELLSEDDLATRVRETMLAAVRRQLVSDVPLGAFLSGGIDSSIMVAAMAQVSASPPKTFSVGFTEGSYDELEHARRVAKHCGTDHHEEVLTPDYLAMVPEVIAQLDQPIADFSVFPTLLVSRMARQRVTVALSGDGGDELFGGYDAYAADALARRVLDQLPGGVRGALASLAGHMPLGAAKRGLGNQLRRFLEGAALPPRWQHMRWMVFLTDEQRRALYTPEFQAAVSGRIEPIVLDMLDNGASDRLGNQSWCDFRLYLCENILPKVDLMSMATSLEARVPYLDNEVIDLAMALPDDMRIRRGVRKYILKKAFAGLLPAETLQRGKEGFSIPLKNWLLGSWNGLMHELLSPVALRDGGFFQSATVQKLIAEHERRTHNHSHILWAMMVFQLWRHRHQQAAL
jgi:asparagine synthase (glutamine-hydrolysing)